MVSVCIETIDDSCLISFSTRNNHLGGDAILRLALAFAQHKNIQKIKVGLAHKSCSISFVSYTV